MVGKTVSDLTTDGFEVRPTGFVGVRTNGDPLYLNRKSTSGAIATFASDGVTKGNISVSSLGMGFGGGTRSSDFFIKTDGTASFSGNLDVNGIIDNTRNNGSISPPNTADHTVGTRVSFYDASATAWYAIGIEPNTSVSYTHLRAHET